MAMALWVAQRAPEEEVVTSAALGVKTLVVMAVANEDLVPRVVLVAGAGAVKVEALAEQVGWVVALVAWVTWGAWGAREAVEVEMAAVWAAKVAAEAMVDEAAMEEMMAVRVEREEAAVAMVAAVAVRAAMAVGLGVEAMMGEEAVVAAREVRAEAVEDLAEVAAARVVRVARAVVED